MKVRTTGNAGGQLENARIAVLVADGFDQTQFDSAVWELRRAGATVEVLAPGEEQLADGIHSLKGLDRGKTVRAGRLATAVSPESFDALLILGGALSADSMRASPYLLGLVRNFMIDEKPIAAVGHGCWLLADAGVLHDGRTVTGIASIRKDLEKAGAVWKSGPVSQDRNLFTARGAEDIDELLRAFLPELRRAALARERKRLAG